MAPTELQLIPPAAWSKQRGLWAPSLGHLKGGGRWIGLTFYVGAILRQREGSRSKKHALPLSVEMPARNVQGRTWGRGAVLVGTGCTRLRQVAGTHSLCELLNILARRRRAPEGFLCMGQGWRHAKVLHHQSKVLHHQSACTSTSVPLLVSTSEHSTCLAHMHSIFIG